MHICKGPVLMVPNREDINKVEYLAGVEPISRVLQPTRQPIRTPFDVMGLKEQQYTLHTQALSRCSSPTNFVSSFFNSQDTFNYNSFDSSDTADDVIGWTNSYKRNGSINLSQRQVWKSNPTKKERKKIYVLISKCSFLFSQPFQESIKK